MASERGDREFELKRAAISIELVVHRLQNYEQNLKSKVDSYFRDTVEALKKGENVRAAIFAEEVARLRALSQKLYFAEMILDKVKTRFEVASIVSPIGEHLKVANELLSEVRSTFSTLSLDFNEIADIGAQVSEVMKITEAPEAQSVSVVAEPVREEVQEILVEAQERAAERIAREFPEVPKEAIVEKANLEERLYRYLIEKKGDLSLSQAAKNLGASEDEIREALKLLREKERISFEETEIEKGKD